MRRLLILPTLAVLAVAETYRRGYAAVVLFGCRQWAAALNPQQTANSEADYMA